MDNYYITPKSHLLNLIDETNQLDDDFKYLIQTQQFWYTTAPEALVQRYESKESIIDRVKFNFLANLHAEYFHSNEIREVRQFILKFLGFPPWSIESFDDWWKIEVVDLEYSLEEVEQTLQRNDFNAVAFQSQPNYGWFNALKMQKS